MESTANTLVENAIQCWTCPIFDKLFAIISNTAGAAYQRLTVFAVIVFCALFAFYVLGAVWQNIKDSGDPFFQKSLKPVLIKSLLALSLLSAGLLVPRLISYVIFEPVAQITLGFTNTLSQFGTSIQHYTNFTPLTENTFFTNELRETIIQLIETSITNFQIFINAGISVMDEAFSLHIPFSFGTLIKHIIVFFIGVFLTYNFGKLFVKYSFCFMDIIVAMAMFAFFFPFSVVFFIFKDAKNSPGWMKKLGGNLGTDQIKKLINAIVSVTGNVLTYTIIMVIIAGFLNPDSLTSSPAALFEFDLDDPDVMTLTFSSAIVLVYVVNYIADQVPEVTKKIFDAFGVKQENALSKEMGENMWKLTGIVADNTKKLVKTIANPESAKSDDKGDKGDKKSDDKKEEDKK